MVVGHIINEQIIEKIKIIFSFIISLNIFDIFLNGNKTIKYARFIPEKISIIKGPVFANLGVIYIKNIIIYLYAK
jgi:hypothetical protein